MSTPPQDGKLIYHLTSLDNLEGILKNGLISRENLSVFDDIAEKEIIVHRESMGLNGFVPFHFFAGTPFDGAVQKSNTDKDFVFITLQRTFAEKNNFKILTQHPLSIVDNTPLTYIQGMKKIDWATMALRNYSDHICCEICMAECLSPLKIDPDNFFCVYTKNVEIKQKVIQLRDKILNSGSFYVEVNPVFFVK